MTMSDHGAYREFLQPFLLRDQVRWFSSLPRNPLERVSHKSKWATAGKPSGPGAEIDPVID